MKILTYGTFDLFHYGHYNLLKRAKELGDYLLVGVSSDKMCEEKGKTAILSQEKRIEIVSNLRFVDKVVLENDMEQKVRDAVEYKIDKFVLGSDYEIIFKEMPEYEALLKLGVQVLFLERTPDISTTELKSKYMRQLELDKDKNSIHNQTNEG